MKNDRTKGIFFIILAALGFSLMTFFVRIAGDLPTMQKAFFRNIVALFVAFFVIIRKKEKLNVNKENRLDILLRSILGTMGLICNFYAVDHLNISDANMLNKLSPFFAIIISIFILKENPNVFDISTTLVAFIGSLFIIKPTGAFSEFLPGLVGLTGGLCAGTAYVFVRKLSNNGEKTPVIVFYFSLFSTMVTIPFMAADFHAMTIRQFVFLLLAGVAASLGQFSITTAYKYAPAKEISIYDYTQVIFAAILGMIFLGQRPTGLSLIGYVLIIGMAILRYIKSKNR